MSFFLLNTVTEYRDKIWKNIRDTYVRLLNGHYKKAGCMTDKSPKFHYMQSVTFLNPYIGTRSQSYERRPLPTKEDSGATVEAVDPDIEIVEVNNTTENGESEVHPKQGTKRPHEYTGMTEEEIEQLVNSRINEYLSKLPKRQEKVQASETDVDGLFGQSIAAQLREMDGRQSAIAKARIQVVLAELKYPECSGLTGAAPHSHVYDASERPERCTMVDLNSHHSHSSRAMAHTQSNTETSFAVDGDT